MRSTFFAAAAVCAALLLTGCGGPDKATYVGQVSAIQTDARFTATKLGEDIQKAKTPAQIGTSLATLGASFDKSADKLAKLEVPGDVKREHEEYVALLRKLSRSLTTLAGRVEQAKPSESGDVLKESVTISDTFETQEKALLKKIDTALKS